jgi:hypothetical protein
MDYPQGERAITHHAGPVRISISATIYLLCNITLIQQLTDIGTAGNYLAQIKYLYELCVMDRIKS